VDSCESGNELPSSIKCRNVACFLPGLAKDLSAPLYIFNYCVKYKHSENVRYKGYIYISHKNLNEYKVRLRQIVSLKVYKQIHAEESIFRSY